MSRVANALQRIKPSYHVDGIHDGSELCCGMVDAETVRVSFRAVMPDEHGTTTTYGYVNLDRTALAALDEIIHKLEARLDAEAELQKEDP